MGGDLIRRITSCPRVVAPVVRRRFYVRPCDRCAVAVFQWWGSIWRRITKTGRTLCRTAAARVSAGRGSGHGREGGGAYVPSTRPETTLILPPCPWICSFVRPCVLPADTLSFCFFLRKQGDHSRQCRRVPQDIVGILMHRDCPTSPCAHMVGVVCLLHGTLPAGPATVFWAGGAC